MLGEGVDLADLADYADLDGSRHSHTLKIACTSTGVSEMLNPNCQCYVVYGFRLAG